VDSLIPPGTKSAGHVTPTPLLHNGTVKNAIDDWWLLSTVAIVALFIFLLINKIRGKGPSRFWIDVALSIGWLCAFLLTMLVAGAAFAGF
jgi:hypothetical protein